VRLSPKTCRVKPLRRIKTQLLHLVGLISLQKINCNVIKDCLNLNLADGPTGCPKMLVTFQNIKGLNYSMTQV